jgi:hypothetical protein
VLVLVQAMPPAKAWTFAPSARLETLAGNIFLLSRKLVSGVALDI